MWWHVGLTVLLAIGVAAGVLGRGGTGRVPPLRRATSRAWTSLPLAARGPVSAALGHDDARYAVHGLSAVNPGQRLRMSFTRIGVSIVNGSGKVSVGLAGLGRAGMVRPVTTSSPRSEGNRVSYAGGGVREWFINGPVGLEQGFDLAGRPAGSGSLSVELATPGANHIRLDGHGGALLRSATGRWLRYSGVSAVDARGRRLRAWLELRAGRLSIAVDDAGARYPLRVDPFIQQGSKLVGSGVSGDAQQGFSVALSSDGSTALVGGRADDSGIGAVWVFVRSGSTWSQQGSKLVGTGATGPAEQGSSVSLSADGNTALIGGPADNGGVGGAWVFTRSGTTWTQQGGELIGTGVVGSAGQGTGVALSADGDTALLGGGGDNGGAGAGWVFTRSGSTWTQQGGKLVGSGETGAATLGQGAALSDDGNTALLGGPDDNSNTGAAWVFSRSGSTWSQQGSKLVGTGAVGASQQGFSVALAGDGDTALLGGPGDNSNAGAAWTFARSGSTWTQQGSKLVGTGAAGAAGQGQGVALSDDGNTALIGGPSDASDAGAAWAFTRSGSTWNQQGAKLVGTGSSGGDALQGSSVALSSDASTALVGGWYDHGSIGAAWAFFTSGTATTTAVTSGTNPAALNVLVTFTANVSPAPDGGDVSFTSDGTTLCAAAAVSNGVATCTANPGGAGDHTILATYLGDARYGNSISAPLTQTVQQVIPAVTMTASADPVATAEPVTLTAHVSPAPDGGTVAFSDGESSIAGCSAVPVSAGTAVCPTGFANPGSHSLIATYSGTTNYRYAGSFAQQENVYANTAIAMSVAQQAGDPAQTAADGSSVSYHGVPLVDGRTTVVRVFADPVGLQFDGSSGLNATLTGTANGQALPGGALKPDESSPTGLGDVSFADQLGQSFDAFNFLLPASWTTGTVTLTAHVSPGGESCGAGCEASLTLTSVGFTSMPKFEVTPLKLTWTDQTTNQLQTPGSPQAAMALAYQLMPVQTIVNEGYQGTIDITSLQNDPGGLGGNQADTDALNDVYNWTVNQWLNTCCSPTHHLHDMVVGFNVGIARGDTYFDPSLGTVSQGKKVVSTVYEPTAVVNAPNELAVAHEMGHAVGRKHADHACGGPAGGGSDPDWPDYRGFLEPTAGLDNTPASPTQTNPTVGSYGVNPAWPYGDEIGSPFVIFPNSDYDYMSYCGNLYESQPTAANPGTVWTSARGWQQEFNCLKSHPDSGCPVDEEQPSEGVVPAATRRSNGVPAHGASNQDGAVTGDAISFRGYLRSGGAMQSPSLMPEDGGITGPTGSPYTASAVDAKGTVVATEPLAAQAMHIDASPGHPAVPLIALQGSIPTHGQAITGLVVRASGHVTVRMTAPRQRPRVTVTTPRLTHRPQSLTLRWNSHDGSKARRTVFVSFNRGRGRYTTIWEGTDVGKAKLALAAFGSARRIRLRVSVGDGFMQSVAATRAFVLPAAKRSQKARSRPAWMRALARSGIAVAAP